jgi:hypothetical protein
VRRNAVRVIEEGERRIVTEDNQLVAPLDVFKNKQISCQIVHLARWFGRKCMHFDIWAMQNQRLIAG